MIPFVRILKHNNKAPVPKAIQKIRCGNNFVAVLMSNGYVYTRGLNSVGQLGVGDNTVRTVWTLSTTDVSDMWVGGTSIIVLKKNGSYQFTGNGVGIGFQAASVNTWTDCSSLFNTITSTGVSIKQISLALNSISVLCSDNTIRTAGAGSLGQLGDGTTTNNVLGAFRTATIPVGVIPDRIHSENTMQSFISTLGKLYYTGGVNAVIGNTTQTSYTVYTLSTVPASSTVQSYSNSGVGLALGVVKTSAGVNTIWSGGSQIFGQMANGIDGTVSNIKAFAVQSPAPVGTVLGHSYGYCYYSQHVITSSGVYAAGYNSGATTYAGKLGIGSSTNALNYTACTLPSGLTDMSSLYITTIQSRTFLTDGNFVYSTGLVTTYGGPASNIFTLDDPRT